MIRNHTSFNNFRLLLRRFRPLSKWGGGLPSKITAITILIRICVGLFVCLSVCSSMQAVFLKIFSNFFVHIIGICAQKDFSQNIYFVVCDKVILECDKVNFFARKIKKRLLLSLKGTNFTKWLRIW